MYFLMMRTIKYAETAIFLAVISASACAIGEECGWRRVCEVPETQIEWEETPSHVRSLSRLVGALDIDQCARVLRRQKWNGILYMIYQRIMLG